MSPYERAMLTYWTPSFCLIKEVYDWLGSLESIPIHFSLHRPLCQEWVRKSELISQSEAVSIVERVGDTYDKPKSGKK